MRPLKAGFHASPPHGLFLHPKAAKKALAEWARKFGLCPNLLGILPDELPKDAPRPVSLVSKCSVACESGDVDAHNAAVRAAWSALPVCDWGQSPRLKVVERDALSGQMIEFVCDSGAVCLAEGIWFVDKDLLAVLKQKFKKDRQRVARL